ncbi:MAG: NnrU family protein, partial [Sphingomonadales bacterium]
WGFPSLRTLRAMIRRAGSCIGNPALPTPKADAQSRAEPKGVFIVTRHPMMWAIGLWAASHIILFWSIRTLVTAAAMGVLALVGAKLQDAKKEALMGAAWAEWESKTSYWPRWGKLFGVGAVPLLGGTAMWLAGSWLHLWMAGIPAGVWEWL